MGRFRWRSNRALHEISPRQEVNNVITGKNKMPKKVIIVGSGNAALSAGIAALEKGAMVTIYEKADNKLAGGNTKYTAGAMRFAYDNGDQLKELLKNPNDERIEKTLH